MVSGNVENTTEQQFLAGSNDTAPEEQIVVAKPPKAVAMWSVLIAVVLLILAFQMHTGVPVYNFLVETDATGLGAKVTVDGDNIGTVAELDEGGVKIHGVRAFVRSGTHELIVSKNGFKPFSQQFSLNGEDYINVTLQPTNPAPAVPANGQTIQLPGPPGQSK